MSRIEVRFWCLTHKDYLTNYFLPHRPGVFGVLSSIHAYPFTFENASILMRGRLSDPNADGSNNTRRFTCNIQQFSPPQIYLQPYFYVYVPQHTFFLKYNFLPTIRTKVSRRLTETDHFGFKNGKFYGKAYRFNWKRRVSCPDPNLMRKLLKMLTKNAPCWLSLS